MQTQDQKSIEGKSIGMSGSMEACIQICWDCYKICSQILSHCLEKGGKHADPKHIKLLADCARICDLSADFMLRHSDYHTSTCEVCVEICTACAESCKAIADDELMRTCVDVCRKCASTCEEMAAMH